MLRFKAIALLHSKKDQPAGASSRRRDAVLTEKFPPARCARTIHAGWALEGGGEPAEICGIIAKSVDSLRQFR